MINMEETDYHHSYKRYTTRAEAGEVENVTIILYIAIKRVIDSKLKIESKHRLKIETLKQLIFIMKITSISTECSERKQFQNITN